MDIKNIKEEFEIFKTNPDLCYLDSGATSLKPKCVINKMNEYYNNYGVNVHRGVYDLSYHASNEFDNARKLVSKFINAKEEYKSCIHFECGSRSARNFRSFLDDVRNSDCGYDVGPDCGASFDAEVFYGRLEYHRGCFRDCRGSRSF